MHAYRLVDDFVDAEAEQALLASLVQYPYFVLGAPRPPHP